MSLRNRLWLSLTVLMGLTMAGSWFSHFLGTQELLREQLRIKNIDNATVLALTLSQFPDAPVTAELFLSAQFDLGHYQSMELRQTDGVVLFSRTAAAAQLETPAWFVDLLDLQVAPGQAQVQQGWRQLGTLTVQSHSGYAYHALWVSTRRALLWFIVLGALALLVGAWALIRTLRPLDSVVEQAQAVAQRRFIQLPQPRIREFRQLVRAMNQMSVRVSDMLAHDAKRLEALRCEVETDAVTGLLVRNVFSQRLQASLDEYPAGHLFVLGIGNLQDMNQEHGHPAVDRMLAQLGAAFATQGRDVARGWRWIGGRLSGAELALFVEKVLDVDEVAQGLRELANGLAADVGMPLEISTVVVDVTDAHKLGDVFQAMDRGLSEARSRGTVVRVSTNEAEGPVASVRRPAVAAALNNVEHIRFQCFPVTFAHKPLQRQDAYVEVEVDGQWKSAREVLPWIHRLGMEDQLDRRIIDVAVTENWRSNLRTALQLSMQAVTDAETRDYIVAVLQQHPQAAGHLFLDVPEFGVQHHLQAFRTWCQRLQGHVAGVGIRHAGHAPELLQELADIGIAHVKLDAALVKSLEDPHTMAVIGGLCSMAHSMGMQVTASGVDNAAWVQRLFQLGVDGMTGPAC